MKNIVDFVVNETIFKSAQTAIQQKIIEICEPLLVSIVERATNFYNKKVDEFEVEKNKENNVVDIYRFILNFAKEDSAIISLIRSIFKSKTYTIRDYIKNYQLDKNAKESWLKRMADDTRSFNLHKLTNVIQRYITSEFVKVLNVNVSQGTKGFEVKATLEDNQNCKWGFETRAIPAGGYNIQKFHYRYIVNLSSAEVPKNIVRQRITETEKVEREKKIQDRNLLREQKSKEEKARLFTRIVMSMRKAIKEWGEYGAIALHKQMQDGSRSEEDAKKIIDSIKRLKIFIDEKFEGKKRQQIFEEALAQNFSASEFAPVRDILEQRLPFVHVDDYYFRQLQRR